MIQQLINFFYRHPKAKLKLYKRFGGYINYQKMLSGRKAMERAAKKLAPVPSYPDGATIYFLTGKKHLYQTLFCIQSLTRVSKAQFKFILVDDGSFDATLNEQITCQLPGCVVVNSWEIEKNLEKTLPKDQYPNLHRKRKEYSHIKKLTDIHTLQGGDWKLVLDSDMLFWKEPVDMINWLQHPSRPLHMLDYVESYGYTHSLMRKLAGQHISPLINVGSIGFNSNNIDWQQLDNWVEALEQQEGKTYYLEQALTAMLIGEQPSVILNSEEYIVNPVYIDESGAVLHHYVDTSKKLYFMKAWKLHE